MSAPSATWAVPEADTPPARDPAITPVLLTIAAAALGHTLQLSDGHFQPAALRWLALVLALAIAAIALPGHWGARLPPWALPTALGLGLAWQFVQLARKEPGIYIAHSWTRGYVPFLAGLGVAALLALAGALDWRPTRRAWFPALLVVWFALGAWVVRASPNPPIDVFIFQQDSSAALLRGENPYAITFLDIYGDEKPYYGPGLGRDGRTAFGFPYPPLSLGLALPGYALAGDHRYAQLGALAAAAALIATARPGRLGALAAALLLFSPRAFFVLEQGWTELFLILGLALVAWYACRRPRALPLALGLLLATKQTLVFIPFLAPLLVGGVARWRLLGSLLWRAGAVTLLVTLPLAMWNLRAFAFSVVTLQLYQPLRTDALSYVAWLARVGIATPGWLAFALLVPAGALVLWRGARTPAGFVAGVALLYLTFFAFNKQAFCNYYFFALGALSIAVGAAQSAAAPSPGARVQTSAVKSATTTRS